MATIVVMESPPVPTEQDDWRDALSATGAEHDEAVGRLHDLLLRAARFEINRRRSSLPHLRGDDFDDLAQQAANDALVAVLRKLDTYRGESRFTTWAYKFALLEAGVRLRKRVWQEREVVLGDEGWIGLAGGAKAPEERTETRELIEAIREAITSVLTP